MTQRRSRTVAFIIGLVISLVAILSTRQHAVPAEFFRLLTNTDTPPNLILELIERREHGS